LSPFIYDNQVYGLWFTVKNGLNLMKNFVLNYQLIFT